MARVPAQLDAQARETILQQIVPAYRALKYTVTQVRDQSTLTYATMPSSRCGLMLQITR